MSTKQRFYQAFPSKKQGISVKWGHDRNRRTKILHVKFRRPTASLKRTRAERLRAEPYAVYKKYAQNPQQAVFALARKSDLKNNQVLPVINKRTR